MTISLSLKMKGFLLVRTHVLKVLHLKKLSQEAFSRVYVKNDYKAGTVKATHVFVGDYQCDEIYNYAALSKKRKWVRY